MAVGREFRARGFLVRVTEDKVLIEVEPNVPPTSPVLLEDVRGFFAEQGWPWQNAETIEMALQKAAGKPYVIVENLSEIKQDAELEMRMSDDKMRAFARVKPAIWGRRLTLADVKRTLRERGITFGVRNDVLEEIVAQQAFEREWTVAVGRPVQNGANARLEYQPGVRKPGSKPAFLPDGRVDLRELDNIIVVSKGQLLATRIPPTTGVAGRNVLGAELPAAPGRDLVWPMGKGVSVVNDQLVADVAGQVVLRAGRIHVLQVYEIPGDVDYSTGNVRFNGNVQIRGSVKPGFTIQAEGDVTIAGGVDCAKIVCGGNLTVGGGIQGQGRGEVKVEGDITTRFIENCKVTAGGSILVGEDIMHSQVFAGRSINVGGRKGLIVGGITRATDSIECKVLGATLGTPTELEVGVNPAFFDQFGQLLAAVSKIEDELARLKQGIDRLHELKSASGSLPTSRQEMLNQLNRAHAQRSQELSNLTWQLTQREQALAAIKDAYIKVTDTVYSGVKIVIGRSVYLTRETKRGGRFRLVEGNVTFSS